MIVDIHFICHNKFQVRLIRSNQTIRSAQCTEHMTWTTMTTIATLRDHWFLLAYGFPLHMTRCLHRIETEHLSRCCFALIRHWKMKTLFDILNMAIFWKCTWRSIYSSENDWNDLHWTLLPFCTCSTFWSGQTFLILANKQWTLNSWALNICALTSRFDIVNIKEYTCCPNMAQLQMSKDVSAPCHCRNLYENPVCLHFCSKSFCLGWQTQYERMQMLLLIAWKFLAST